MIDVLVSYSLSKLFNKDIFIFILEQFLVWLLFTFTWSSAILT